MYDEVQLIPRAAKPGRLRVWLGVFGLHGAAPLTWLLDGTEAQPDEIRALTPATSDPATPTLTHSGVYEFDVTATTRPVHSVEVEVGWPDGRTAAARPLTTRTLPAALPTGFNESFNVLLVSCFYEPEDSVGRIGALVGGLVGGPDQPDLVLAVGDQVYLDNPVLRGYKYMSDAELFHDFEHKYRKNWQGYGYSRLLQSAPVATIPDDHDYWNNYPHIFFPGPTSGTAARWKRFASELYDAFQLSQPGVFSYELRVDPLSIFMLDSRTHRVSIDGVDTTMGPTDVAAFDAWVADVLAHPELVPVLVTGPSLFQPPKGWLGRLTDRNYANASDYPHLMSALLDLAARGRPVLTLTGDVHYGRTLRATHATGVSERPWAYVHEVISSPASLVSGLPRPKVGHPDGSFKVQGVGASLACEMTYPAASVRNTRDHVVVLKFRRTPTGVALETRYHNVEDGPLGLPATAPPVNLQRFPDPVP